MSKHTPGPWKASRFDPWETTAVIIDDHPMPEGKRARRIEHIATVSGPDYWANARLIAAAPDLLAALEQAVDESGWPLSGPTDWRAAEDGDPKWVCNARAAIAAAKGEG